MNNQIVWDKFAQRLVEMGKLKENLGRYICSNCKNPYFTLSYESEAQFSRTLNGITTIKDNLIPTIDCKCSRRFKLINDNVETFVVIAPGRCQIK